MSGPLVWAQTPEEGDDAQAAEKPGEVDESFAARRLRRWLQGMFGGTPRERDAEQTPDDDR